MKRFYAGIAALAVLLSGLVLVAPPLSATAAVSSVSSSDQEPPSCDDVEVGKGTGECADVVDSESHSKSSSSSRATSVNGVKLSSKVTVLARIRANGTPKSQQDNCYTTNRPMSLWTSYNAEGTTGWHWKSYPKGKRFCRINGAVRDPICHNQVKIGVPKSNPPKNAIRGKVKFVKKLKWQVKAVAKADEKVTTHAKAWCNTSSASAFGEGRGSAAALAIGRGSARGSVLVKLFAQAEARAAGDLALQLDGQSVIQVKAKVRATAFAKASSEAHAKAECKDNPQPPVIYPPSINIDAGACVKPGEQTGVINGTVSNPNDEAGSGTVTLTPTGKTASVNVPAGGQDSFSFSGLAPGSYKASVTMFGKTASDTVTVQECPPAQNKPPTCELVKKPKHMYVSLPGKEPSRFQAKAVWSDPDEQLTKDDATVTVTGQAFIVKGNDMFPERWDTEGNQVVYTFWIETTQQTGNATLSMVVHDSEGAKCEDSETYPVVEDEF